MSCRHSRADDRGWGRGIPAEHRGVGFGFLSVGHGADIERRQVHAEQFCYSLSAVNVPVFIQNLKSQDRGGGSRETSAEFLQKMQKIHLSLDKLVPVVVGEGPGERKTFLFCFGLVETYVREGNVF